MQNFSNITVYHGSYMLVNTPELDKCKNGKDFGNAGNIAISNLEPENLKNHLCFKSDKALKKLQLVKSENVPL